jgi:hypothetical protein
LNARPKPLGEEPRIAACQHLLQPGLAAAHHLALRFRDAQPFRQQCFQGGIGLAVFRHSSDTRGEVNVAGAIVMDIDDLVTSRFRRESDDNDETLRGLAGRERLASLWAPSFI